ncbi:MAG TPA: STAS domain-containing protein [Bryobacteraceae bacterium]|nr:STAS domain-containing protein [Bryobacteraceae bacterium]
MREAGGIAVVDLSGRITLGEGSGVVRAAIKDLIAGGQKKMLLNLGDVSYIDSAGLGELVGAYATVSHAGGKIKLLNVQKRVNDLLQVTKLYSIFEFFTDETAALASFGSAAEA